MWSLGIDLNHEHGQRVARRHGLKAGMVWANSHNTVDAKPRFGGFKQSGIGREHGRARLEGYLETKTVVMRHV